jgi:two-component system NtrC family sensor kinase
LAQDLEQRVEERTRELRATQRQMVRSEKLAMAGRLAAAIAHEVNNPLQAIRLYLELLAGRRNDEPRNREYLDVVQNQVDRIANIITRLLELYQPSGEAYTPVDLNALVKDLVALFSRRLRDSGISVELDLAEGLPPIIGARNGLRQVCLNVLLNAIEAMPDGGPLRITSQATGDAVCVSFVDSGIGIAPEDLPHVFDPFFSTKHDGAGLGLAASLRIVQEHGGDLAIESRPGSGTTVRLSLPITDTTPPTQHHT